MVCQWWSVWQRGGLAAGSECKRLAFPILLSCCVTMGKSLSLRAEWGPWLQLPGRGSRGEVRVGASLASWACEGESVRVSEQAELEVLFSVVIYF